MERVWNKKYKTIATKKCTGKCVKLPTPRRATSAGYLPPSGVAKPSLFGL